MNFSLLSILFILTSFSVYANDSQPVNPSEINITAVVMFIIFISITLGITYWAAKKTRSASDFYTAGGNISGLQNGLAIAGDYMSAASFLGISGLVFASGFDGLISNRYVVDGQQRILTCSILIAVINSFSFLLHFAEISRAIPK